MWSSMSHVAMHKSVFIRGVKLIQCCRPHLHTWILYGPDSIEKKLSRQDCISVVPKHFGCWHRKSVDQISRHTSRANLFLLTARHYLEIITSSGNDLRRWFDVGRNGADLRKKKFITSLAVTVRTKSA